MDTSKAMMATTTSSSIKVKAFLPDKLILLAQKARLLD
jgi:spore coat protein CotF